MSGRMADGSDDVGEDGGWLPLVRQAQRGDREAFDRLVERFRERVVARARQRLANHQDAEEVTQEAFVQAWRELASLRDPSRFPAWLHRIARTRGSNFRTRWRQDMLPLDGVDWTAQASRGAAASRETGAEWGQARLRDALGELTDVNRVTAGLYYVDGHSVREIAGRLHVPAGTVKRRLHDARTRLKQILEHKEDRTMTDERSLGTDASLHADDARRPYDNELQVPAGLLLAALRRASVARATDAQRPMLDTVAMRWDDDGIAFWASDGFRMAEAGVAPLTLTTRWASTPGRHTLLLTPQTTTALVDLLATAGHEQTASFVLNDAGNDVMMQVGDTTRLTGHVGGDCAPLMPIPKSWEEWRTRVRVRASALLDALRAADLSSREGAPLLLEAMPGRLRLYANATTANTEPYESSLPITLDGAPQRIALNGDYLLQTLEVMAGAKAEISWGDPQKPMIVRELPERETRRSGYTRRPALTAKWALMPMTAPRIMQHQFVTA